MRRRVLVPLVVLVTATTLAERPAVAAVQRGEPRVAHIVATKGDGDIRFVDDPRWRVAEVQQDLLTGDSLRTGPYGGLAILFVDDTQIRVHRNTTLAVKSVRPKAAPGETRLGLERGAAWSRARAVPDVLKIDTPAATTAIRGTDWHVRVEDDGRTTVIVLSGRVELANPLGALTLERGEIGFAEVGRPPTKTFLLRPKDRPQWQLVFTPDWLRMLPVTGLTPGRLAPRAAELAARPDRAANAEVLLELAELAYEMADAPAMRGDLDELGRLGEAALAAYRPRLRLLEALHAAALLRFDDAERAFAEAIPGLEGRRRLIAELGRVGIVLVRARAWEAEAALARLEPDWRQLPEYHLARVLLSSWSGEQERARELAREGRQRFPDDSRFALWLAHLALLLDEPDDMRRAVDEALVLDPDQYLAWQLDALYHLFVVRHPGAAERAYRRALAVIPRYAPAWNGLALVAMERGDLAPARRAVQRAIELAPDEALYQATYATLLALEERLDDAVREAERAIVLDPQNAVAMSVMGLVAIKRGRGDKAIEWMLQSTVANPGLAGATTSLAIAHYQAGDFQAAEQAILDAMRLDPNDPLPALIAAIFAVDQAEAGKAIRHARETVERAERVERFGIEGLAKSQDGTVNVGSAYRNLALDAWGEYYGHLLFDPAGATSHFFLANVYPTARARRSEAAQGLLLDPLAVSARARYFDLVRRPFFDVTLGGSVGSDDGGLAHGQRAVLQGLARLPAPVALALDVQRTHTDGPRTNSAVTAEDGALGVGASLRPGHDLLLVVLGGRAEQGVPGPARGADPDDRAWSEVLRPAVGYHAKLGPENHVLLRLVEEYRHDRFVNDDPLGTGLSDLSLSLIRAFGVAGTRALYDAGLCEGPFIGVRPFTTGGACGVFPFLARDLPPRIDLKTIRSVDREETSLLVQARHQLEVGPVRGTYGAEWLRSRARQRVDFTNFRPGAPGVLFTPAPVLFTTGAGVPEHASRTDDEEARLAYAVAEWRPLGALRLEGGLFGSHFEDDLGTSRTQIDPRAGIAWRPVRGHWLRAAVQRGLTVPIEATLAPVATVGLLNRDDLTPPGGSSTSYQGRWDAEWGRRLFTFVAIEEQRLRRFFVAIPLSLESFAVEKARLTNVVAGTNVWLGERWGVLARHRWTWTENVSRDPLRGRDLPLVPERTLNAGLAWVHPAQVRAILSASYVGDRPADPADSSTLGGYWTADLRVTWQPGRQRWSFTAAATNLLDERYEVARGFPGQGLSASLAAEYRFGGP